MTAGLRDEKFDILKGIGIIFLVVVHLYPPVLSFMCLFHMPMFFIASGVFFKPDKCSTVEGFKKLLKSRVIRLYIPYVLFQVFFTLIHNFLYGINFITDNPDLLYYLNHTEFDFAGNRDLIPPYSFGTVILKVFSAMLFIHSEQIGIQLWFLRVLFLVAVFSAVLYFLAMKYIKNEKVREITILAFFVAALIGGFICQKLNYNYLLLGTALSSAILFYFGILYKRYEDKIKLNFLSFSLSLLILSVSYCLLHHYCSIFFNEYPNIFWYLTDSCAGFIFILCISKAISIYGKKIPVILSYFGKHTISILLFHYLAFKIVTCYQVWLYDLPDFMNAAFPYYNRTGNWWIVYLIFGLSVPLLISFVWEKIKIRIYAIVNKNN